MNGIDEKSIFSKVQDFKTPTLFLVGKNDLRCPPEQTETFNEFIEKLKRNSICKDYPNVGHDLESMEANTDSIHAKAFWFEDHLMN